MNFDMNRMLREAQRMQVELAKAQEEAGLIGRLMGRKS